MGYRRCSDQRKTSGRCLCPLTVVSPARIYLDTRCAEGNSVVYIGLTQGGSTPDPLESSHHASAFSSSSSPLILAPSNPEVALSAHARLCAGGGGGGSLSLRGPHKEGLAFTVCDVVLIRPQEKKNVALPCGKLRCILGFSYEFRSWLINNCSARCARRTMENGKRPLSTVYF